MLLKEYPYLKDENFLIEVDNSRLQNQLIKLTLLDWTENPLTEIQGIATGGSISINGNSSIRRTCTLTMSIIDEKNAEITNINNLISIGRKVFIEVGIKNKTNQYKDYPILWYPQGLFVFTQATLSSAVSQTTTLSAQLKDKMCLLNGECGGTFTSSVQFDVLDTIDDNGDWITIKPTITQIIREAVNHFGKENISKILISDIDEKVKMVQRWTGGNSVYLILEDGSKILTTNKAKYDPSQVGVQEFRYGDDIGFIYTDFTYPSELIVNPGDNICTGVLDKIKSVLGNYEYFYDIYGNFIFQEIKNYLNTSFSKVEIDKINNGSYIADISKGKSVYSFVDSLLPVSYSNNPQYNRIKNDFVIWGTRNDINNIKHAIRYHLAIDRKPNIGNIYEAYVFMDETDGLQKAKIPLKYSSFENFPKKGVVNNYYLDSSTNNLYTWDGEKMEYILLGNNLIEKIKTNDWRSELYFEGASAEALGLETNYYYAELEAEWPKLYNFKDRKENDYYLGDFYEEIKKYPWDVDYWLDFIDSQEAINNLNINLIGRRSLSVNNDDYNCVFEPEVPDIILIETGQEDTEEKRNECISRSQDFIQVDSNIFANIASGGLRNSCFEQIKTELYNSINYSNSISLGCVPIYHIDVNTRITVLSKENNIFGDYMINSISIPLAINGTMNISASKCDEKI